MIYFITVPLIASGIFYASNGENHIRYIDALFVLHTSAAAAVSFLKPIENSFLCTSAMTVTVSHAKSPAKSRLTIGSGTQHGRLVCAHDMATGLALCQLAQHGLRL